MTFQLILSAAALAACLITAAPPLSLVQSGNKTMLAPNTVFTSLSIEWSQIRRMFLNNIDMSPDAIPVTSDLNSRTIQMINNLILTTTTPNTSNQKIPTIRIGGNSATKLYWKASAPWSTTSSVMSPVGPLELKVLDLVATATNSKLLLNVGMRDPIPANCYIPELLQSVKDNINALSIAGIEVGNEPDHNAANAFRPATYAYPDFLAEFKTFASAILASLPGTPLVGPSFSSDFLSNNFASSLNPFISDAGKSLAFVSLHSYELSGCSTKNTLSSLLAATNYTEYLYVSSASAVLNQINPAAKLIVTELGSASCGGVAGISDVFGSALWAVDAAFQYAALGVSYANFAGSPQALYAPISIQTTFPTSSVSAGQTKGSIFKVQPTYYGMMMFGLATSTANNSIFQIASSDPLVNIWVSQSLSSTSVVIINKLSNDYPTSLAVPAGTLIARSILLSSSSGITSKSEFTIAGIDFNNRLNSNAYNQQTLPITSGTVQITVPSGAALLIKLAPADFGPIIPVGVIQNANSFSVAHRISGALCAVVMAVIVLVCM